MSSEQPIHTNSSNMSLDHPSVMNSISGSVRLTGSPVFDMMLATLVSGVVLQHLPQVAKYVTDLFNMLLKRIAEALRFGFNDYRHSVEITSCSKSESESTNRFGEQMHTPDIQSADNLPLIIGTLHYFQKHRIHFGCSGSLTGHVQAALSERTTRDQLHKAILSFIPDVPVMHEGMRFTFTSDVSNEPEQPNQQQRRNRYDDYDYDEQESNRRKQKTGGMISTMTMHVDGNDLNIIQDFLKARFHEEVDLAYPKPDSDDDKTYMFELKEQDENHHGQGLMWYRSPYSSSKTFRTVFFDQKQTLIDTINHFENKTGPWAPNRERPNKLVIMLEGLPGSGKTGSIKSIASMTKRHILTINASDLKDDSQVARLFRDDSMQYLSLDEGWRHEIVPLNKRILVFDDLDCTGSSDWLLDRTKKKDKSVDLSDMIMFGPDLPTKKKGKGKMKGFGSDDMFAKSGPTLGGLLNVLDGVCELNGQIVILTTNHIDMFDPALYRAGRVDLRVKMGYASSSDLIAMVECAFGFTPLTETQKVALTDAVSVCKWTGSDVQELLQGAKTIDQAVEIFVQKHKEQQDKTLSTSISNESLDSQNTGSM